MTVLPAVACGRWSITRCCIKTAVTHMAETMASGSMIKTSVWMGCSTLTAVHQPARRSQDLYIDRSVSAGLEGTILSSSTQRRLLRASDMS